MFNNFVKRSVKISVAVTFVLMVVVNALANILPINGIGTGAVSDSYPNLFAPAGTTFSIWGIIYMLLAAYTLYQIGYFNDNGSETKGKLINKVGIIFSISSIANTIWIFTWHYMNIPFSMLLMLVILGCLIYINKVILATELDRKEKLFISLPFSVYFGWITVATIANATILLVSLGFDGFGISEPVWTIIVLLVGLLIGTVTLLRNRDYAYGLVLIWAYLGILIKHTATDGFDYSYFSVINTLLVCVIVFVLAELYLLFGKYIKFK
ncbi:MAG: hypothetical protein FD141_1509 [Fusobacteria bacterium]|nr:MAG: hypothetical protein FD141_1509 [Fusobacteriota bacterium]KAF0230222.1 MAG: hypothetical protein FD182_612 [Fusobacteriota bacterium]